MKMRTVSENLFIAPILWLYTTFFCLIISFMVCKVGASFGGSGIQNFKSTENLYKQQEHASVSCILVKYRYNILFLNVIVHTQARSRTAAQLQILRSFFLSL